MTNPVIKRKRRGGGGPPPSTPDDLLVTVDIDDPDYPNYVLTTENILSLEDLEVLYGRTE
jgi:hypothetical protein